MKINETVLKDAYIIEPQVFEDERGYFFESYQKDKLSSIIQDDFFQDNQSMSSKGVLRGLHFQAPPYAQGKLVRVIQGCVMDVIVDLRKESPSFGKHIKVELSGKNKRMLWVPEGFAHGFYTLENETIMHYKSTKGYNKASERTILWNDKDLSIDWDAENPILSEKDMKGVAFEECNNLF